MPTKRLLIATFWAGLALVATADLIHPGFENGDLSNWATFGQGWRIGGGGDAYSGSYGAVNDVQTSDGDNWRGIFQNVAVTEGGTYTAGVFIRAVNVENSTSWFELQWLDAGNSVIGQEQSSFVTSDQAFTFMGVTDVVAPVNAVSASIRGIVFMPSPPAGDTDYHIFDDFSIVPEPGTLSMMILGAFGLVILRRRHLPC